MIEINLIPEDLKAKTKSKRLALNIAAKDFLFLIPLFLGLLICAHAYLAVVAVAKNHQLRVLNNKWQGLQAQRKILDDFQREYNVLSSDANEIKQLISERVDWAEKLNKLSLNLPSGIWFNDISVTAKDFLLQGSVVSLQKEELNLINKLIDNLKNDKAFFRGFKSLELSSVQKKTVASYDVVDFLLTGALKPK